jgi:hypothetical protein
MSDNVSDAEVSRNGTQTLAPQPLGPASIEERLATLRETVRTWDWRAALLDAPPPPTEDAPLAPSSVQTPPRPAHAAEPALSTAPYPTESREEQEPPSTNAAASRAGVPQDQISTEGQPAHTDEAVIPPLEVLSAPQATSPAAEEAQSVLIAVSPPAPSDMQAVPVVTEAVPAVADSAVASAQSDRGFGDFFEAPVVAEPELQRGPDGPFTRLWAHPWTKLAALCLVVVVAVLVIVGGLRLAHRNPESGSGPAPTTVTGPTTDGAATTSTTQAAAAIPVTAAQLVQYKQYSAAFEAANATTKTGLAGAGASPTLAQITPIVATYLNALKLYNLQFHYVQWPASMQTDVSADEAQLSAMMNFVPSVGSIAATDAATWLSELHAQATTLQAAENKIHQDLGLPASTSLS